METGLAKTTIRTVRITPIKAKKAIDAPITAPMRSSSFCPRQRPIITVMPIARPVRTNVTRLMMLDPVDTPESPSVVPNHTTIMTSTAPYIACKIKAPRIGNMKNVSFLNMLPLVKSDMSSIVHNLRYLSDCVHKPNPLNAFFSCYNHYG